MNFGTTDTKILRMDQWELIAALRHATHGSWAECRRALENSDWNFEAARQQIVVRHT